MKAGSLLLAGKGAGIQAHQHDHPVGDGAHRLQGADREGAAAVAETAGIGAKPLIQSGGHHSGGQCQRTVTTSPLPIVDGGQQRGPFPGAIVGVAEQILQQLLEQLHPGGAATGPAQFHQPVAQAFKKMQPAPHQLEAVSAVKGSRTSWRQSRLLGQHQAQEQAVAGPGQAACVLPTALCCVKAPSEAKLLQLPVQQGNLLPSQLEAAFQGRLLQQGFQAGGGEALGRQPQQLQQAAGQAGFALLTSVRQPPRQIHAGGVPVAEHRRHEGRNAVHIWRHHQDVAGLKAAVGCQQLQDAVAHDLHLAQAAWTGMKFQGWVAALAMQRRRVPAAEHELPLELVQQVGGMDPMGGVSEQVPFLLHAQLNLAAPLQQLLKFPAKTAETGLEA